MTFEMEHLRFWRIAALGLVLSRLLVPLSLMASEQPTIEELKARVPNASIADRPGLCVHISELQTDAADRLYIAGDSEKAQAALADVVAFSELARDYSIQAQVQNTIDRLQRIRDDLLAAMFPKGVKK